MISVENVIYISNINIIKKWVVIKIMGYKINKYVGNDVSCSDVVNFNPNCNQSWQSTA